MKKKVQMYLWSKDILLPSIIERWAIKVCALSPFTLHSMGDWSLDIHKEIIVMLNLHKLSLFCGSLSILHFSLNFSLEIQFQVYGKKQVLIIWQPWGICLVCLEGALPGAISHSHFGAEADFIEDHWKLFITFQPCYQAKGRLRPNNHHIGKLLGQKILDVIDCFVLTPYNFCVQDFCNTYVGAVVDSVVTLVF